MSNRPQKCAACGKEKPLSEMKVCMVPGPLHRYVCDSVCMMKLYEPKPFNPLVYDPTTPEEFSR